MNGQDTANRRRQHYVDVKLQRWLIIGLCLMQVLAVGVVLVFLDAELRRMLEMQLYRVHYVPGSDVRAFAVVMGKAFGLLALISALALVIADWLWSSQVRDTLEEFNLLVERTRNLDLGPAAEPGGRHELLRYCGEWRERERQHYGRLRTCLAGLRTDQALSLAQVRQTLAGARALLATRSGAAEAPQSST